MGMSLLDETFEVYVQMRRGGWETKAVLESLRMRIELMTTGDRMEMVRRVKAWEAQHASSIKSSKSAAHEHESTRSGGSDVAFPPAEKVEKTVPCPRCGKLNSPNDVFCAYCGNFLSSESSRHETTKLDNTDMLGHGPDYFGPDSTLVLTVVSDSYTYSVQPQRFKHETVIGRSEGSTMKPDIDLSAHNAGGMGVSRLHVALQYNPKNSLLSVSDMKSANGTFINGQKLFPQEVRVIRDGDELRLGRLVLRVFFKHPDATGPLRAPDYPSEM